jgi:Core-2/I-Branching enzyme
MMKKHAYLIMAHNNFGILEKLIRLLDYEKNDIYLHVDSRASSFDKDYFSTISKKSNMFMIDRLEINWGGLSQVNCELKLLENSVVNNYQYYHLLSGVDLPLKSQDYIHDFFNKNEGKEFVGFVKDWDKSRVKYYYLFNEVGRSMDFGSKLKRKLTDSFVLIQRRLGVDRTKHKNFAKGANWFSITHDLTNFIVQRKDEILELYNHSILCDEVFLQTEIINSKFKENLYKNIFDDEYSNNLRHIDWERGTPYIFQKNDFNELINSDKLFARKFDETLDMEIVDLLYNHLSK